MIMPWITVKVSEELKERVRKESGGNISAFVRRAIIAELDGRNLSSIDKRLRKIESMLQMLTNRIEHEEICDEVERIAIDEGIPSFVRENPWAEIIRSKGR